jgi:peptidoglycan/xylan/chitin deacetylase (PgdA/CDA1 family)
MYHDIVGDLPDASGFPGPAAASYKLPVERFDEHLRALAATRRPHAQSAMRLAHQAANELPFLLTFDDGGRSAYTHAAERLERYGWRGHFFVTTDHIGKPAFLSCDEIKDLARRGHLIGSHSTSHPTRMSSCSREELLREWRESTIALAQLIGGPVRVASVPGGYFSRLVAETAAEAGIQALFTSEPTTRVRAIDGCSVIGRFTMHRATSPATAAALVNGRLAPRVRQAMLWNAKKAGKAVGGRLYLALRARFFDAVPK